MTDLANAAATLYGTPAPATAPTATPAPATTQPAPAAEAQAATQPAPESVQPAGDDSQQAITDAQDGAQPDTAQPAPVVTADAIKSNIPDDIREQREADPTRKLYSPQVALAKAIPDDAFAGVEGMAPEAQTALVTELREMAADVGFVPADIPDLSRALFNPPQTEDARIASREQAVQLLNAEFGQGAKQALLDARAFVAADARRAQILQKAGDNPRIVLRIAQLARQAKMRGGR